MSVLIAAGPSLAQSGNVPGSDGDLRARQAELYDALKDRPDDLDLMALYAKVSIELEDYEAAISTMERMLIYRQDLPQVRRELGVAYFNLGSYQAAQLYLEQVLEDDSLPAPIRGNVEAYLAEIGKRTRKNRFDFTGAVGVIHSTNANFGPEGLLNTPVGLLPIVSGEAEADTGIRTVLSFAHDHDLQRPNNDIWRTTGTYLGIRYFDVTEGDTDYLTVRTGPRLSLNEEEFGPKIRPYLDASYVGSDDSGLYYQVSLGGEYTQTLSTYWSLFADVSTGFRNMLDQDLDGFNLFRADSEIGVAYIPTRDLIFRGSLIFEQEAAEDFENTNTEIGGRLGAEYQYFPGFDFIETKWRVGGFLDLRGRFFPGAQRAVGLSDSRQDLDFAAGFSHVFGITDNWALQFDMSSLVRSSNIQNFDLDNVSVSLSGVFKL
ncbi:MAG: tetratricopeptide repeat protein [Pseudomonadota bacterium]